MCSRVFASTDMHHLVLDRKMFRSQAPSTRPCNLSKEVYRDKKLGKLQCPSLPAPLQTQGIASRLSRISCWRQERAWKAPRPKPFLEKKETWFCAVWSDGGKKFLKKPTVNNNLFLIYWRKEKPLLRWYLSHVAWYRGGATCMGHYAPIDWLTYSLLLCCFVSCWWWIYCVSCSNCQCHRVCGW